MIFFSSIAQSEKACFLIPSDLCIYLVSFPISTFLSREMLGGHHSSQWATRQTLGIFLKCVRIPLKAFHHTTNR